MRELYKKIKIPNFEIIKSELLALVSPQISQNLRYWDLPFSEFFKSTPVFCKYIENNFYRFPILFRFYNSPPFYELVPHIDNLPTAKNRIGFNIPLAGTENTAMNYYDTTNDNLEAKISGGLGSLPTQFIKDETKLVLIDSFEVDQPTLLRTDAIHSVSNPNETYRLVLGMKFIGTTFDEVYKEDWKVS
jgi:hypothetical protein